MRIAMLALAMVLSGLGSITAVKASPIDVGSGRVAWFDLTTTSLPKSTKFYGELFKWEFIPVKGTDQAMEIVAAGNSVGTIRVAEGDISAFNGVIYIQVADLPTSCRNAKMLGGTIPEGFPFNLPDGKGAIALVLDPGGHPIGMYSKTPLPAPPSPGK
jgi:predicted enzyme related to lactoylglutathione lyase